MVQVGSPNVACDVRWDQLSIVGFGFCVSTAHTANCNLFGSAFNLQVSQCAPSFVSPYLHIVRWLACHYNINHMKRFELPDDI